MQTEYIFNSFNVFIGIKFINVKCIDKIELNHILKNIVLPINQKGVSSIYFDDYPEPQIVEILNNNKYIEGAKTEYGFVFEKIQIGAIKSFLSNDIMNGAEKICMRDMTNSNFYNKLSYGDFVKKLIANIENCVWIFNCFSTKYKKYHYLIDREEIAFLIMSLGQLCDSIVLLEAKCENKKFNTKKNEFRKTILPDETEYIEALRSIAVAHPFDTTRHEKYDFNEPCEYVCIDLEINNESQFIKIRQTSNMPWKYFSFNGLLDSIDKKEDILLNMYHKINSDIHPEIIGIKLDDIEKIIRAFLNQLYTYDEDLEHNNSVCQ